MRQLSLIIKIIIIYTCFLTSVNSETLNKIIISGNERISNETVKMFSGIEIGDDISENKLNINLTSDITKKLQSGTNQIKIFGISDLVLKPDIYETNFIIVKEKSEIPKTEINFQNIENEINYDVWMIGMTAVAIMIGITIFLKKRF